MRDIRFKTFPVGSAGLWEQGTLLDLIKAMPTLQYAMQANGRMLTLEELNLLLATGRDDAGMSGGCEWKPFTLLQDEYDEMCLEILTEPQRR